MLQIWVKSMFDLHKYLIIINIFGFTLLIEKKPLYNGQNGFFV